MTTIARAIEKYDALIVGAGPAGLAAAIRLKQLCRSSGRDMRVGVLEKGATPGAHVLSGCVLDPIAIDELLPHWRTEGPRKTRVTHHAFQILTGARTPCIPLPRPPPMKQRSTGIRGGDTFIVSLGDLSAWMAEQAEALGVEVLPGCGADELLVEDGARVVGVATKDVGIGRDGKRKAGPAFQRGVELRAPFTLLAEGCKGHLTERAIARFGLRAPGTHQTYALGLKEIWRVRPEKHQPGLVSHSVGWPADGSTWAGSFEYHAHDNLVYLGYAIGLDYTNPHLDPFQEFQKLKMAPAMAKLLAGGECLQFGARTMTEGGIQAVPRLVFPGGAIAGCGAGFMNVSRLKGAHTAMKTGMLAAEVAFASALRGEPSAVDDYERRVRDSWVWRECHRFRNMKPAFRSLGLPPRFGGHGLLPFLGFSALDAYVFRGKLPFTFSLGSQEDHQLTVPANMAKPKHYAAPNGITTFDRNKSLSLTGVNHIEDQPSHLVLRDKDAPVRVNHQLYAGMDARYCPAGVYEYHALPANPGAEPNADRVSFTINAANCLHCKTCEIKDPTQNVRWTLPQGPGGPAYSGM